MRHVNPTWQTRNEPLMYMNERRAWWGRRWWGLMNEEEQHVCTRRYHQKNHLLWYTGRRNFFLLRSANFPPTRVHPAAPASDRKKTIHGKNPTSHVGRSTAAAHQGPLHPCRIPTPALGMTLRIDATGRMGVCRPRLDFIGRCVRSRSIAGGKKFRNNNGRMKKASAVGPRGPRVGDRRFRILILTHKRPIKNNYIPL
jgi:hypothetical protein